MKNKSEGKEKDWTVSVTEYIVLIKQFIFNIGVYFSFLL